MVTNRKDWEVSSSDSLHLSLTGQHHSIVLWEACGGNRHPDHSACGSRHLLADYRLNWSCGKIWQGNFPWFSGEYFRSQEIATKFPFCCRKLKQNGNFSGALTKACFVLALLAVILRKSKKQKKKKSEWVGTAIKKKYRPEIFWRTTAMQATVLAQCMTLLWGGLNLLKIVSFKSAENKFLFCLWASHKTKSMHIHKVYCWPANLKVVSWNNEVIDL